MSALLPIDKDVPLPSPLPKQRRQKGDVYSQTIDALQVGESFVFPDFVDKALAGRLMAARARNLCRYTYRRIDEDTARVWRVS